MTEYQSLDLTPGQAAARVRREITDASQAIQARQPDAALDGYVHSLGLALQLGPGPTEQVLVAVLSGVRSLICNGDAEGLSAWGPALVELVARVRAIGALPPTAIMEAWASVASDLATILGQIGLASSLPPDRRPNLLNQARARLVLLDDATHGHFDLLDWWQGLALSS